MSRASVACVRLLLPLLVVCLAGLASANTGGPPFNFSSVEQMTRPPVPARMRVAAAPTGTSPRAVQNIGTAITATDGSDGLACFQWGSTLRLHCSTLTIAALVQTATVGLGERAPYPLRITDAEGGVSPTVGPPSGHAPSSTIIPGSTDYLSYTHLVVGNAPFRNNQAVTFRGSSCSTGNLDTYGHPCDEDADCGTGGACTGPRAQCAFLVLKAVASAGTCYVVEER